MHLDTFIMMAKFVSMQTRTSKSFLPLVNYAAMKQEENKNLDFQFVLHCFSELKASLKFFEYYIHLHTKKTIIISILILIIISCVSGEYTGSSRCTISAANDLPCRMASASEIIISGYGMTCSSARSWIMFNSNTKIFIFFFLLIYGMIV